MTEHVDVLVVGAGISGISAGWHIQTHCPDRRYLIVEARQVIGGTWDLFRYPGVRSDSDMHTLGFAFRPWTGDKSIADGAAIRDYIEDTAREFGIDRHIRFSTRVVSAAWSSIDARWTVETESPQGAQTLTCSFLDLCAGYYDYAAGHAPTFVGADNYGGRIVHPQFWPQDIDLAAKQVVVIGSGATAVTLVPALASTAAASVTMLQRSPSYIVAQPAHDRLADALRRFLPARFAYRLVRGKNIILSMLFFQISRRWPDRTAKRLIGLVQDALGSRFDTATHFTPRYDPWDQRVCLTPDGDFFTAIREGRTAIVTDTIVRFETTGIRLGSGKLLPADVVVTATGLEVKIAGGIALSVDGVPTTFAQRLQYRGMMFEGVPNLVFTFGYTNASWTLKADLTALYMCRLLNAMRRRGARTVVPNNGDSTMATEAFVPFSSGYIQRAADRLPLQGTRRPWRLHQNYLLDIVALRFGSLRKDLRFFV